MNGMIEAMKNKNKKNKLIILVLLSAIDRKMLKL